jgi:hypothetical protein
LLSESAKHDSMSRSAVAAGELTAGCAGKNPKELARIAEHLYVASTSLFHTLYFDSPVVIWCWCDFGTSSTGTVRSQYDKACSLYPCENQNETFRNNLMRWMLTEEYVRFKSDGTLCAWPICERSLPLLEIFSKGGYKDAHL